MQNKHSCHSHRELCCTDLENYFVNHNEERPADNPICSTDGIFYSDQSDDDDEFQVETNHAGQPTFDWCYEFHHRQLESRNHPFQSITKSFHIIGNQQSCNSKGEELSNKEFFEQNELSLEKEETFKYSPDQEYNNLFTEFSSLNPSILGLQEDNTAKYDESSSSDNEEDEGEKQIQDYPAVDIPSSQ